MSTAELTLRDRIVAVTAGIDWATIDQLERHCIQAGVFEADEFRNQALSKARKAEIRRAIKTIVDEDGNKVFASVETTDEDGKRVHVYKQETLFNVDDYRQSVDYWAGNARYAGKMAIGFAYRCEQRFGVQLEFDLTFDD